MSAAVATWSAPPFDGLRMSENVKKPLLAACRHLLHPLVRILLRHGISHGEFADSVRGAYIDIAQNELVPPDRPQTDARIAILTGLTKHDVARIRSLAQASKAGARPLGAGFGRLPRWFLLPRALARGAMLLLPRASARGAI